MEVDTFLLCFRRSGGGLCYDFFFHLCQFLFCSECSLTPAVPVALCTSGQCSYINQKFLEGRACTCFSSLLSLNLPDPSPCSQGLKDNNRHLLCCSLSSKYLSLKVVLSNLELKYCIRAQKRCSPFRTVLQTVLLKLQNPGS